MANVAFLGLGVMGYPMAGHLKAEGHEVTVYNRSFEKAEKWVEEHGGTAAPTPAGASADAEFVFACVGADKDIEQVCIGDGGAFESMADGTVFIDNTTVSAGITHKLYTAAKEKGIGFIDAPVSGGEAGAINGQLTVMCGGDEDAYAKATPVIDAFAKMQRLIGPSGAGQLTKCVNQICIAGVVQGLSEALHFAMSAGLDTDAVVDVISKGAAQSWQMENRAETMVKGEFDFGFAVDWMRKDLAIVLEEAEAMGITLPITQIVDGFYADVQDMGGNRNDTSSLIRRLRD